MKLLYLLLIFTMLYTTSLCGAVLCTACATHCVAYCLGQPWCMIPYGIACAATCIAPTP